MHISVQSGYKLTDKTKLAMQNPESFAGDLRGGEDGISHGLTFLSSELLVSSLRPLLSTPLVTLRAVRGDGKGGF